MTRRLLLACVALLSFAPSLLADNSKLASLFPPGEDWQVAAEGMSFPDGLSADGVGNVYFCDMRSKPPVIWRLSPEGEKSKVVEASRSGTRIGPDGRLYACGGGKVVAYELTSGKEEVLVSANVQPNDLTVTPKGYVYFTETAKHQVTFLNPKTKELKAADVGIDKPNGIATGADGVTLLVSDNGGFNIWRMKIQPDGSLTDKQPAGTMQPSEKKPNVSGGDGMTVDTAGRAYVTTYAGLQVFDRDGQLLGVLPKPQDKGLINACFGGKDLSYLYVACGDKVYRRKTLAKGALSYQQAADAK
jgi:gluconolactonase